MNKRSFCHFCSSPIEIRRIEGRNRFYCQKCKTIIYENPLPAVCTVVTDQRQRLLLVKRSIEPKKGFWCLPGGFMEIDETSEKAALRELSEETGLTGKINTLIGVTSTSSKMYNAIIMVGYLVTGFKGNLIAGDDASDAAFFRLNQMPEIAFDSHKKFIRISYSTLLG